MFKVKLHILKISVLILLFGGLTSCEKKASDTSTIAIQTTNPAGELALLVGEEIKFDIGVLTQHAPKGSSVGLIIQASDDSLLGIATPIQVNNGQIVQLSVKTIIPVTTSVNVYAALYENENKDSIAVDSRSFKVIGVKR